MSVSAQGVAPEDWRLNLLALAGGGRREEEQQKDRERRRKQREKQLDVIELNG